MRSDRAWDAFLGGGFLGGLIGVLMMTGVASYLQDQQSRMVDELARDTVRCGQTGVAYAHFTPDGGVVACRDGRSWTVRAK